MRIPEDRPPGHPQSRAGRQHERDLSLRYLAPGAFTVLPPDEMHPEPPTAPTPYRLTPTSRRHKNQAFAIIAEPTSNSGSRSPSPSGRVSPFRGRGFNPAGSRHASPAPSPPPPHDDQFILKRKPPTGSTGSSPRKTQIPKLARRGSDSLFGEDVFYNSNRTGGVLSPKLSKSMSNLPPKKVSYRQPLTQKNGGSSYSRPPAFQQLSPILGSSPEPDQAKSQSSRIPRSHSTPPSRHESPVRKPSSMNKHPPRAQSRNTSRNTSRETSPSKMVTSPTRATPRSYRNVQAKVNSFNKPKPKVPAKPDMLVNTANDMKYSNSMTNVTDGNKPRGSQKSQPTRDGVNKNSTNTPRTTTNVSKSIKNSNQSVNSSSNSLNRNINNNIQNEKSTRPVAEINGNSPEKSKKRNGDENTEIILNRKLNQETKFDSNGNENAMKKVESMNKLNDVAQASSAVVSSTTTTAAEPLKIEAKLEERVKSGNEKMGPIVDGRILSATSVSNAMNKMNDTVLSSNTIIKEHNFSKLSPAASAIISMSNTANTSETYDPKSYSTKESVEAVLKYKSGNSGTTNDEQTPAKNVSKPANIDSNKVGHTVNNINKFATDHIPHGDISTVRKNVNDKILDARTVVAADVQPLRITVREKPVNTDVQSGNVRINHITANGVSEIPGLPPPHQPPQNEEHRTEDEKLSRYRRFVNCCKNKVPCACCRKSAHAEQLQRNMQEEKDKDSTKTSCFSCRKSKKEVEERMSFTAENEATKKPRLLDRLKCCGKNKVADKSQGCCPRPNRKEKWASRADSILGEPVAHPKSICSKVNCRNFLRRAFCVNRCCKKKLEEDPVSRRESVLSKKKSLTISTASPPEDNKPKLDLSLVEHASHMKGAIPVLPIRLAWFCLICNILVPGTGTVLSGLFCLCIGKPRFSQKDGAKQRIGAFIIDLIIGCGQLFTVLFCLVGWGWSIWWGVIMVKLARKQQKIKLAEESDLEERQVPAVNQNNLDVERGPT